MTWQKDQIVGLTEWGLPGINRLNQTHFGCFDGKCPGVCSGVLGRALSPTKPGQGPGPEVGFGRAFLSWDMAGLLT